VARLKEEVEHSKRIIHELRSELHTITLRAQTTTESTGRLDAKVVQLNHELDHERALVNRLKDEQLGKNDFHGSTTSTSQYTNLPHIFLTSSSHLPHIFLTSSSHLLFTIHRQKHVSDQAAKHRAHVGGGTRHVACPDHRFGVGHRSGE
jgi:hypothetical protein